MPLSKLMNNAVYGKIMKKQSWRKTREQGKTLF